MASSQRATPVVLIPGLLNTEDLWRGQISGLADLGDIRVTTEQCDYDSMREIAAAILRSAPPHFALAGLSLGGYAAFEILRQASERVVKLALLDTTARPDTQEKAAQRREAISKARERGVRKVLEAMLPNLLHPDHVNDPDLRERLTRMAEELGVDVFERQQTAIMNRRDSRSLLAKIRCSTLVLCGREDKLTPPELAREMADGIPDSRLGIVEKSGHLSAIEQPERVTEALREWLA